MKSHSAITALKSGSETMIQTLRDNQETYQKQINFYARCNHIWITAGIPLLIPIPIGFIGALFGISLVGFIMNLML